jgi:diguanylate cyclase (GGDEF)-like protein/PAS domain S-box-containing protein
MKGVLMSNSNNFELLFHSSMDAIVKVDAHFNILEINRKFEELFRYKNEHVVHKNIDELFHDINDSEKIKLNSLKLLHGERIFDEGQRKDSEGNLYDVVMTGIPIIKNGIIKGAFIIYKDVTKEKQAIDALNRQKMIFESLFSNSSDAIIRIDKNQHIIEFNENYERFFGYSLDEVKGKLPDPLISSDDQLNENTEITTRLLNGEKVVKEGLRYSKDGTARAFLIQGVPIVLGTEVIGGYGIYTDISEQKNANKKLSTQKNIFEALFKNSSDAIVRLDSNQNIIEINDVFTDLFGYYLSEIKGQKIDEIISTNETMRMTTELTTRMYTGEKIVLEGVRFGKNNQPVDVLIKGIPILEGDQVIGGYGIYTDISDRKKAEREIMFISYHDQLTGLYNRRFFEEELRRLDRSRNIPIALIMADVNGLKLTNDAFGHSVGDQLLERIAAIIIENCRKDEIIARLGGDEFVILLPHTELRTAEEIVHRIKVACENEVFNGIAFSLSFGCDTKTSLDEPIAELFKRVENHMYRNKLIESPSFRSRMFDTIIKTLHDQNDSERSHSQNVSMYCEQLGMALNLSQHELDDLKSAGWLHDIGKIAIPQNILNKEFPYSASDWVEMKKHPEIGYRILSALNEMSELATVVLAHHERYDGTGYPKGLIGEDIPLFSRIICIADAYDAMTHPRGYLPQLTKKQILEELRNNSGTQFDPELIRVFINLIN